MAMNTHDRWMLSTFRGAPAMPPTAGTLIAVLDAFLLTGYGHVTALSGVIAGGICTVNVNAGEFFEVAAVIQISVATPAGLNGVARVSANTATTVSWPTGLPDGPVTGPIGLRYAPVPGWEKAFSKTNVSVYRSTHTASSGMCLRVDDSIGVTAGVRGYKSMTDVDTGVEPFPLETRMANPIWSKSFSGATAKPYALWGDRGFFAFAPVSGNNVLVHQSLGFGDPIAIAPAGDTWSCLLGCQSSTTDTSGFLFNGPIGVATGTGGGVFMCRPSTAAPASVVVSVRSFATSTTNVFSGADSFLGDFSAALDGRLALAELFATESLSTNGGVPRAILPGLRHVPQNGFVASLGQRIPLDDGGVAITVPAGNYVTRSGTFLFELGKGRA